jgi:hypothetical protein
LLLPLDECRAKTGGGLARRWEVVVVGLFLGGGFAVLALAVGGGVEGEAVVNDIYIEPFLKTKKKKTGDGSAL